MRKGHAIFDTSNVNPHMSCSDTASNYYGGRHDYWIPDYDPPEPKRKHEFSPVLLINSTVYDCKHCKRKKEDCKTDYCEEEGVPPNHQNLGDWG